MVCYCEHCIDYREQAAIDVENLAERSCYFCGSPETIPHFRRNDGTEGYLCNNCLNGPPQYNYCMECNDPYHNYWMTERWAMCLPCIWRTREVEVDEEAVTEQGTPRWLTQVTGEAGTTLREAVSEEFYEEIKQIAICYICRLGGTQLDDECAFVRCASHPNVRCANFLLCSTCINARSTSCDCCGLEQTLASRVTVRTDVGAPEEIMNLCTVCHSRFNNWNIFNRGGRTSCRICRNNPVATENATVDNWRDIERETPEQQRAGFTGYTDNNAELRTINATTGDPVGDGRRCELCIGLHPYNYKPTEFNIQHRADEKVSIATPLIGFELELECQSKSFNRSDAVAKTKEMLKDFTYQVFDGSLDRNTGFEVVSHPFTYRWWRKTGYSMFSDYLNYIKDNGVRSWNTEGRCAIHVHLSKKAFTERQLLVLLEMVYDYAGLALKVAQRGRNSKGIKEYARLDDGDSYDLPRKAREFRNVADPRHYHAVNLGTERDAPTVEIRIYRGTTKPQSFSKNIEHAHSLWRFTQECGRAGEANYLDWLQKTGDDYPYLRAFLESRGIL